MDDSDNMSTDDSKSVDSVTTIKTKPKKRSLVERELETNLTARITSPVTTADGTGLSRYGRARRLKTEKDSLDQIKVEIKSPVTDKSPMRVCSPSPVYKMHASNTPIKTESPKMSTESYLENQIESIYQENISLSRFASEEVITSSPLKKLPKVYIRKDLIQRKDPEETVKLIKNIFSPDKGCKPNSHLRNILERSERFSLNSKKQYGHLDNSSVVKMLDFDSKKKKEIKEKVFSKNELFELEAKCMYQVGDLAWARMSTYPFWPCIITRDPASGMFVKKKLFGRVEHDILHVTFFGDNGRRSWIVDNLLRNYSGLAEFERTRQEFTVEDKKKDPRLYAAFFISEKKQVPWKTSVDEADILFKEPKRFRIELFNDMLEKSRSLKTTPKLQKKVTRTDSDVSLSESLYDSLFSEDDGKVDDSERSRNKCRNKSLDVSEVVTACLDNMAAKTGIIKIQKQSHMDRWLQKAKSKTPEKMQVKTQPVKVVKLNYNRKWKVVPKNLVKPYSLRRSGNESHLLFNQNEHDYSRTIPDIFKIESEKVNNKKAITEFDKNVKENKNVENSDSDNLINKDLEKSSSSIDEEQKMQTGMKEDNETVTKQKENIVQHCKVVLVRNDLSLKIQRGNEIGETELKNKLEISSSSIDNQQKSKRGMKEDNETVTKQKENTLQHWKVVLVRNDISFKNHEDVGIADTELKNKDLNEDVLVSEPEVTNNVHNEMGVDTADEEACKNLLVTNTKFETASVTIKELESDLVQGIKYHKKELNEDVLSSEPGVPDDVQNKIEVDAVNNLRSKRGCKNLVVTDIKVETTSVAIEDPESQLVCKIYSPEKELNENVLLAEPEVSNDVQNILEDAADNLFIKDGCKNILVTDTKVETASVGTEKLKINLAHKNYYPVKELNQDVLLSESVVPRDVQDVMEDAFDNLPSKACCTNLLVTVTKVETASVGVKEPESNLAHKMYSSEKELNEDVLLSEIVVPSAKQNAVEYAFDNLHSKDGCTNLLVSDTKVETSSVGIIMPESNLVHKMYSPGKELNEDILISESEVPNVKQNATEDAVDNLPSEEACTNLLGTDTKAETASVSIKEPENHLERKSIFFDNQMKDESSNRNHSDKKTYINQRDMFNNTIAKTKALNIEDFKIQSPPITDSDNVENKMEIDSIDSVHCEEQKNINKQEIRVKTSKLDCEENEIHLAYDVGSDRKENLLIERDTVISDNDYKERSRTIGLHKADISITKLSETRKPSDNANDEGIVNCTEVVIDCNTQKNTDSKLTLHNNQIITTDNKKSTMQDIYDNNDLTFPNEIKDIEAADNTNNLNVENSTENVDELVSNKIKVNDSIFLGKQTNKSVSLFDKNNEDIIDTNITCSNIINVTDSDFDGKNAFKFLSNGYVNYKTNEADATSLLEPFKVNKEVSNECVKLYKNYNFETSDSSELSKVGNINTPSKCEVTTMIAGDCKINILQENDNEALSINLVTENDTTESKEIVTRNDLLINKIEISENDATKNSVQYKIDSKTKENSQHNHYVNSKEAEECVRYVENQTADIKMKSVITSVNGNSTKSPNSKAFLDTLNNFEMAITNDSIAHSNTSLKKSEALTQVVNCVESSSDKLGCKDVENIGNNKCIIPMLLGNMDFKVQEDVGSENDKREVEIKNKENVDANEVREPFILSQSNEKKYETFEKAENVDNVIITHINKHDKLAENLDFFHIRENGNEVSKPNIHSNLTENECKAENDQRESKIHNQFSEITETLENVDTGSDITEFKIKNKFLNNVKVSRCIENGYHDSDSPDIRESDDDFDVDAVSINSEDSAVSLNKTDKNYRRKLRVKGGRPLEDPEFLKYLEMRQDSLIDENPGLNDEDIIGYLYKTYLYEESMKSDLRKSDDIEQSNLVKGLNERINKKNRVSRSVRDSFFQKKKDNLNKKDNWIEDSDTKNKDKLNNKFNLIEDSDSASINSDTDVLLVNKDINKSKLVVMLKERVEDCKGEKVIKTGKMNKAIMDTESNASLNSTVSQISDQDVNMNQVKTTNDRIPKNTIESSKVTEDKIYEIKKELDPETASIDSEASDIPLIFRKTRSKVKKNICNEKDKAEIKKEVDSVSVNSEDSDVSITVKQKKYINNNKTNNYLDNLEFVQYMELRQDALIDENPQLTREEIVHYLYKTWRYEEEKKSALRKTDEFEQSGLVKGLEQVVEKKLKVKKKYKGDKDDNCDETLQNKPRRKSIKPFYNEEYSDLEEELEVFEIFKIKSQKTVKINDDPVKVETEPLKPEVETIIVEDENEIVEDVFDEVELYFEQLAKPKPNIFKGLVREKVCEICETASNLLKCKSCHGMFHIDCVKKKVEVLEVSTPSRGRKKKKRPGRKAKSLEDSESQSDEKCQDISEENNMSIEDIEPEARTVDADIFEKQLTSKMNEMLDNLESINYDSYSSDDGIDWSETIPGKCEIVDVKLKLRSKPFDYSDFKCNNCQKYDMPVCSVCKSAESKTGNLFRQKCNVAHCHKYYHLECLDHWPQTQFNAGEPSKNNKKISEHFEALSCPRHVCHTCVSDDPRGCKTRFSGDKLARCIRCPATYHSFTKCVPAGSKILTGSHIICPRHYEHRPGKVPCHVNTGWCFICALGGTLICCEYCPTSFHAECLNIDPPEGGYMCEDCETGRLPLYGEMVWVKLGHYRWWPGIILHPSEISENILSVRHSLGEFVVRFFGQYDHYWVNRGRVFPFQEGDSGRVSSQKSKIDAAFTTAMEHAQRACEILKRAEPNEEESLDIASSLLPPHYVKLKINKPIGSVCMKKVDEVELSLTQCECDPNEEDPCGPYSQCLNRMLLTECGPSCRAGDRCNNRAFEKRLYPKMVPYRTPHRGWGLKTLEDIKAGQFVIEYVGELIDEEEFQRRMRRKHEIRDENYYFLTLDKERMIDAGPKGNLARFMNHCCEPNCETQKWTVLGDVRVGLFAIHDIPANCEVTFNYNLECAGIEKKRCLCGTKRCSGYMGAKPKQDESQSKKKLQAKRPYKKRKPEESPSTSKKQKRLGRPPKVREPRELTEIEKDLLIIKSATNLTSDDSDFVDKPKALKRKRVSFSTEEVILFNDGESSTSKRSKNEVGD